MGPDDLELASAVRTILAGTPAELAVRGRAELRLARAVCEQLGDYRPPVPPSLPSGFAGKSAEEICAEARRDPAFAANFGAYRNLVLLHEETCAKRLEVLRSTARVLIRHGETVQNPQISAWLEQLSGFVVHVWRLDLNLGRDRGWSLRVSRKYHLLPIAWRYV